MNAIFAKLMSRYESREPAVRLRARFLIYMCLFGLILVPFTIGYTIYLHLHNPLYNYSIRWTVIIPLVGLLMTLISILVILARGYFTAASHALVVLSFITLWSVMFADRAAAVSRLDTIVLMVAILSMTPLAITKRNYLVVLYGVANIAALFVFMFTLGRNLDIPSNSFWDYLADNTVALVFVIVAAYNILSINKNALDEADRLNLELKTRNVELQAAMEELEGTNEALVETNTELELANEHLSESEKRYRFLSKYNERLNEIFIFFTEADSLDLLFERITGSFKLLTGAIAASSSAYDLSKKTLRVVSVTANDGVIDKVESISGVSPFSLSMRVPDELVPIMLAQVINIVENLEILTFGAIDRKTSSKIMEIVGCERIVVLALHYGSELVGTTVVYLPKEAAQVPDDALKTFAYMAGLAVTRKKSEEALSSSLSEKEILLKEIHHRVKNNLQIIVSLLNMQAMKLHDENLLKHFTESNNRIRSMAKIHDKLYRAEDMSKVDFTEYLREIAGDLYQSARYDTRPIQIEIRSGRVMLGIKEAVPCGLIVNEILTNSFKHAFPPGYDGEPKMIITLSEVEERSVLLEVSDNGVGIKDEEISAENETMGLSLIRLLVKQMNGTMEIHRNGGTAFSIIFPYIG